MADLAGLSQRRNWEKLKMNEQPDKTPEGNVEKGPEKQDVMSKRCRQCGCLLDDAFCSSECQQAFEKENPGRLKKEKLDDLRRKWMLIEWKSTLSFMQFLGFTLMMLGMMLIIVHVANLMVKLQAKYHDMPRPRIDPVEVVLGIDPTGVVAVVVGAIILYIAGRIIVRIEKKLIE